MKKPRPAPTLPEVVAESIATTILFWLLATRVEPRNDPPMIVALLAWTVAHGLIYSIKAAWRLAAFLSAVPGRLAARLAEWR